MTWFDLATAIADAIGTVNGYTVEVSYRPRMEVAQQSAKRIVVAPLEPGESGRRREARGLVVYSLPFQVTIDAGPDADGEAYEVAKNLAARIEENLSLSDAVIAKGPDIGIPDPQDREKITRDIAWVTLEVQSIKYE